MLLESPAYLVERPHRCASIPAAFLVVVSDQDCPVTVSLNRLRTVQSDRFSAAAWYVAWIDEGKPPSCS